MEKYTPYAYQKSKLLATRLRCRARNCLRGVELAAEATVARQLPARSSLICAPHLHGIMLNYLSLPNGFGLFCFRLSNLSPVKTNAIRSSGLLLVKGNGKRLVIALEVEKMLWYNGATRNLKNEGQDGEVLTPKSKANQVITNNPTPYDGIANFVSTITSLIQIATPSFHPSPKRCLFRIQKLSIKKCFSLFQYNSTSLALLFYFLFFIYSIFFTFL
jgi:hypothetical protein